MDDVSYGADNDDMAYKFYLQSKSILAEGGFNLRKFVTNSAMLVQRIEQHEASLSTIQDNRTNKISEEDQDSR